MKQKRKAKNYKIGTFDIETDPFKRGRKVLNPFVADFYDGNLHYTFWGKDCLRRVTEVMLEFPGIIYAHNGGKFDFHFLLPELPDSLAIFCIDNRIASLKTEKTEFRDSFLILPVSLAKFGSKIEIDYDLMEADKREAHKEEIITYLKQDTEGLRKGVLEFINHFGMNLTLAGASFKQLEKEFGIKPVRYKHKRNDELFRPFYFGGRCQVFKPGTTKGNLTYIDINSAYPRAMLEKHAFGKGYLRHKNLSIPEKKLQKSFIHFWGTSKGVLPERKKNGGIHFPYTGETKEWFATGWEFVSGIKRGKIKVSKVEKILTPTETKDFSKFVNHFYAQKLAAKKAGDSGAELFAKLMLNSSYGKFALNPDKYRDYLLEEIGEEIDPAEKWQWIKDFDEAGFSLFERPSQKEKSYYNVATAASITGWVRAFMSESIDGVKTPLYCDTDSIICEDTGDLHLGDKLGEWKIEAKGTEVHLGGKKIYAFRENNGNWKTASKGCKLGVDEIVRVCSGEIVQWESEAPNFSVKRTNIEFVKRKIKITT